MANLERYDMRQAQAIIAHCERTAATHSNRNIDMSRTRENYALWPPGAPDALQMDRGVEGQSMGKYAWKRLRKRLSEVSVLRRRDVNVLCDWVIHLGVDTPPGYDSSMDFFEACVRYIGQLYGSENIIYAWVHLDEGAPHIHIGFVPVTKKPLKLRKNASEETRKAYEEAVAAGKTVIEKVDAKSVITRQHLQGWHPRFSKWMTEQLGYDPGVHTGITEALGGNLSVPELKRKGPNWAEKRRKQSDAYHSARRAARAGQRPRLNDRITISGPKTQADERPAGRGRSLEDMIHRAHERHGK